MLGAGGCQTAVSFEIAQHFRIADAGEASYLDELASQRGFQAFVTVKLGRKIIVFDRGPDGVKTSLQKFSIKPV